MSDAQHTPPPWSLDGRWVIGYPDSQIAVAHALGNVGQPAEANAEFIVRAVNCHGDLLKACLAAMSEIEAMNDCYCDMLDAHYIGKFGTACPTCLMRVAVNKAGDSRSLVGKRIEDEEHGRGTIINESERNVTVDLDSGGGLLVVSKEALEPAGEVHDS